MEDGSGNAGRKATLVLVSNFAGAALGYVSLLLIGRYFSPDSYGAYLFALSLTGLVAVLSNLGLGIAHQRHVAQGADPGRAFGVLARLRLAIAVPLLGLGILAYLAWSATHERALTDATTPTVLAVALTIQVLSGARQSLFDTWQGQQRVHRVEACKAIDTILVVLFLANAALLVAHLQGRWEVVPGIGGFWAGALEMDAPPSIAEGAVLLATAYVLAKGASFTVALAWWLRDGVALGPWDRALARSYLRLALPLAFVGSLAMVLQYTDTLLLGYLWTDHEVGIYGVALRLSSLCLLGGLAVGAVLFPRFAQLHAAGDLEGERRTFLQAERYLLMLAAPIVAAMVALPANVLHIAVGDGYLESATPLRLLALWALVLAMEQPISSRLMGIGETSTIVRVVAVNAVGNLTLNLALVPRLGPTGSGIATLASTAVAYAYLRSCGRRSFGIAMVDAHQARILVAAAAVCAGWWGALGWAGEAAFDRAWELAGWGVLGGLAYASILFLLGELRRGDLDFLRKAAHPGALLAELRGR